MTAAPKYKLGDRVVYSSFGARKHGTVRSLTKASAMVDFDDGTSGHIALRLLNPETPEDISRRQYERDMRDWREQRPNTTQVIVFDDVMGYRDHVSLTASTPAEMREAAAERLKLADWFEERPVEP